VPCIALQAIASEPLWICKDGKVTPANQELTTACLLGVKQISLTMDSQLVGVRWADGGQYVRVCAAESNTGLSMNALIQPWVPDSDLHLYIFIPNNPSTQSWAEFRPVKVGPAPSVATITEAQQTKRGGRRAKLDEVLDIHTVSNEAGSAVTKWLLMAEKPTSVHKSKRSSSCLKN
jgi:hypothetical protein